MADIYKELLSTAALMDTDPTPADTIALKAITLEKNKQSKLEALGGLNQGSNLSKNTYSLTKQGNLESNKNKIWNDDTSAEVQGMLGEAASKYQIYQEDGKWFQGTGADRKEYTGDFSDTQRAYMYGTKDDPNAVKFGLARGDLPSSDYRYLPGQAEAEGYSAGKRGYGWDAGEQGVDLGKKYMDMVLPKDVAIALEGAIHGRTKALENRVYPNMFSGKGEIGSGASEYYTSAEGMLGNTQGLTSQELAAGSGKLEEYRKIPVAEEYHKPDLSGATDFESYSKSGSKLSYEDWANRGDQRDSDGTDALQVGAARWWGKTQEMAGELLKSLAEQDKEFLEKEDTRLKDKYNENVSEFRKSFNNGIKEAGEYLTKRGEFIKSNASEYYGYNDAGSKTAKAVWGELKQGNVVKALENVSTEGVLGLVAESLPEMAMYYNPVTLVASYGGNVAEAKKEAEKIAGGEISTGRMSAILLGEGISIALDKAVFDGIISPAKAGSVIEKTAEKLAGVVPNVLLSASVKYATEKIGRVAGAVAAEGTQEVFQEGQRIATTQLGQKDVLTEENLDRLGESLVGGGLAGGAMRGGVETLSSAGDMLKGPSKELQAKRLEKLVEESKNEVKTNMENTLDMEGTVDVGDNDIEVEEALGVDSVTRIYNESKTVDEMLDKMMQTKRQVLGEVYQYDEDTDTFTGVKDASKLKAVEQWLENYAEFQADKDGNIPKSVKDEVDYFKNINSTFTFAKADEMSSRMTDYTKKEKLGSMEGMTEEDKVASIDSQVDEISKLYNLDTTMPEVRPMLRKKLMDAYELSGMAGLGNGIRIELDKEALAEKVRENAGLKAGGLEQRPVNPQDKVVELGTVTNEELASMIEGFGAPFPSDHPNTKFRERHIRKLDPTSANSVVGTLRAMAPTLRETVNKNEDMAGKVFKGGDVKGNMLRLMLTTANTINGQTASDSQQRRDTISESSALRGDEYWASYNNVLEQAGKDYVSSHGMRLAGDAKEMAKFHRELGRFGIKLLQDAGLAEVSNDYILSKAGSAVDVGGGRISTSTVGVGTEVGKDALTGAKVTLVKDKGVKLTDTRGVEGKYESNIGDAIKRVVKIILPNAERLPSNTYVKEKIKKDPDIQIDKITEQIVEERMSKPHYMKSGNISNVFKYLKGLNDSTNGGIGQVKGFKELKRFLLLEEGGSELLKESEQGSIQGKIDNLIGILDNYELFSNPNGVYTTFQVDINDRLTVRENAGNYQSDKVYSRPMLGTGKYDITTDAHRDMIISSLADELESYEDRDNKLSKLEVVQKYADIYKSIEESIEEDSEAKRIEKLISIIANTTNPGKAFSHMRNMGGIRILSVLEGAKDVVNGMKDDGTFGTITTEYISEKDASASGVFNVTMNFSGRDVEFFKKRLMELGVEFDGEKLEKTTDAYRILGNIIKGLIDKAANRPAGIGHGRGEEGILEVKMLNDTLKDEKLLRQLAKYPIMTWFYSAGETSIIENLVQEMTHVLIERAVDGNENVLKYLSDVMGKEVTAESVKELKKGSKEHIALRSTLQKVGEVYYSKLDDAFPEIRKAKEEMSEYFRFLSKTAKVNGTDYWKGTIRTGVGAVNGTDVTTSIYKWKNQVVNMTAQEKIDSGLATEEEGEFLLTLREKLPNETSLMALLAHNVDAVQAILGQGAVTSDNVIQSKHDGFSGRPADLLQFQDKAEEVTVEAAIKYDFVNEMVWAMKHTMGNMKEALKKPMKDSERKNLEYAIRDLETKIGKVEEINEPRLEAKKELLKGAKTWLFGKDGHLDNEVVVKEEVKTPEDIREEAVKKVFGDVLDMVSELDTTDERKAEILANKENVKLVAITDKVKKELARLKNKELNGYVASGGSFTHNGTVYVGKMAMQGIDQIETKKATAEQVLDMLMHEIEHAVVDKFISKEANGEIKEEYSKLETILNRAVKGDVTSTGRVSMRVENILHFARVGDMKRAIKELVATSKEEEVAGDVFNELNKRAGISGSLISRLIKQIWDKVMGLMERTPVSKLLAETDVYSVAIAVKSIQNKARGLDKGIAKEEDGKIAASELTPFEEDFVSGLMKNINIC